MMMITEQKNIALVISTFTKSMFALLRTKF